MKAIFHLAAILIVCFGLNACNEPVVKDTQTAGSIKVSVDETYRPVMEQQFKLFASRYPNAHIQVEYKSEAECFNDFLEDTTRVIFVTRELTEKEKEYCLSKKWVTKSMAMARDAVAFITSADYTKPQFTTQQLQAMLLGQDSSHTIVFDNPGSSTVRYISDSLLGGKKPEGRSFATQNANEVIDYVAAHPKSIGVIGVSWIADNSDSTTEQFLKKIQVAGIRKINDTSAPFIRPFQAYIGLQEYPCTRNFYFITKESWVGLGTGLVNFLCKDGQLVFKQAKLFPLRVNVLLRDTRLNTNK
ncbi:MAG: PstS family phosphate ABC transporter substrate-binding protein [Chitinophagaceae bacterium]